jgi:hypothetical protein
LSIDAHDNVARLDITVNEVARVKVFQATNLEPEIGISAVLKAKGTYQLTGEESNSLDSEFEVATDEKVLKRRTQTIECHHIESSFSTKPTNARNAYPSGDLLVHMMLVFKEMLACSQWFELKHDVLLQQKVVCREDFPYLLVSQILQ